MQFRPYARFLWRGRTGAPSGHTSAISVVFTAVARTLLAAPLLAAAPSPAAQADQNVTTSHGFAVFGELKYPADFKHFDYVNPNAAKGGTYRFAQMGSYESLNQFTLVGAAPFALWEIYDPLMERSLDEPASYYGVIAESISYPENLSWVEFKLRPQARWHDGRPITPEDVMFTVDSFDTKGTPIHRRIGAAVDRAVKTGPRSVRMYLVQPDNRTLVATVASMPVVPKHYYEDHDLGATTLEPPLGNGPYKVGKFSAGRYLEIDRVDDYWARDIPVMKGRFNFDTIRHDWYRDILVMNEAFLAGHADLRWEGSSVRWDEQDKLPAFRHGYLVRNYIRYENGVFYQCVTMNARHPFLRDRRVRKAISLAYDFEWGNRVVLHGRHERIPSVFANTPFQATGLPNGRELALLAPFRDSLPPDVFSEPISHPKGGTWENRRRNLLEAAALLRSAGYEIKGGKLVDPKTGDQIRLELALFSQVVGPLVVIFAENMERLGIDVKTRVVDSAQFRQMMMNRRFDLAITVPQFPPFPTPGFELSLQYSSRSAEMEGTLNFAGVSDPAIDSLLQTVIGAQDRQKVVDGMKALDRLLMWNYYTIPMQHSYPAPIGNIPITYWNKFGRPPIDPTYNFPFLTLDHWWIDEEKLARIRKFQGKR